MRSASSATMDFFCICSISIAMVLLLPTVAEARAQRDIDDNDVTSNCRPGFSQCSTNNRCVHDSFFCDGDNDCGDNSDENIAFCRQRPCANTEVRCHNGQCIETEEFCSEQAMCRDGSIRRNRHFCPNAEPSFDMCLDVVIENCVRAFPEEWTTEKIIVSSMAEICRSVSGVKRCADDTIAASCHENDVELMPEYYRLFRSDYETFVDIICRQEIEVIGRHKACMLGRNADRVDIFNMIDKCIGEAFTQRVGCGSLEFKACLIGEVRRTCGDEIAATVLRHNVQVTYALKNYLVAACGDIEPQR